MMTINNTITKEVQNEDRYCSLYSGWWYTNKYSIQIMYTTKYTVHSHRLVILCFKQPIGCNDFAVIPLQIEERFQPLEANGLQGHSSVEGSSSY